MQVSLHLKCAEVSRDLMKEIGVNLLAANNSGSFRFGMGRDFLNDSGQLLIRELGSTSFWSDRLLGLNFSDSEGTRSESKSLMSNSYTVFCTKNYKMT